MKIGNIGDTHWVSLSAKDMIASHLEAAINRTRQGDLEAAEIQTLTALNMIYELQNMNRGTK
jgi:hypothetical protein